MRILSWGLEERMSMKAVQLSPHYKRELLYAKTSTRGKGISMVWKHTACKVYSQRSIVLMRPQVCACPEKWTTKPARLSCRLLQRNL